MSSQILFDVVVVGAGPAGATTARHCALLGLYTALVEKERFPRQKPCAGGISRAALALLDFPLPGDIVERECRRLFTHFRRLTLEVSRDKPIMLMVARDRLDDYLLSKAREAGAEIFEGYRVRAVEEGPDRVTLRAGDHKGSLPLTFEGRVVIGADGASSVTARRVRPPLTPDQRASCLEVEVPASPEEVEALSGGEMHIYYHIPPKGFGWVFPHRRQLAVGVGSVSSYFHHGQAYLQRLLALNQGAGGLHHR